MRPIIIHELVYTREHFNPRCDAVIPAAWDALSRGRTIASHDTLDELISLCRDQQYFVSPAVIAAAKE